MSRSSMLGLIALLPLALNVSAPAAGTILMPMCSGDGQVLLVPVPGGSQAPASSENGCCIKGCHAGSSRKRLLKEIEPAQ
ncbi:MAG: hypothetical protein ABL914_07985 [Novosphingobium sp.]|uniref:hypothetical protein n=1 Tax=Novosphingobium sp. TaxID=1874826 RepID=UPI0032BD9C0F